MLKRNFFVVVFADIEIIVINIDYAGACSCNGKKSGAYLHFVH